MKFMHSSRSNFESLEILHEISFIVGLGHDGSSAPGESSEVPRAKSLEKVTFPVVMTVRRSLMIASLSSTGTKTRKRRHLCTTSIV